MPDCMKCQHDESVARELGCGDDLAPKALYSILCSACGGVGCGECDAGRIGMRRCPRKLTERRPDLHAAVRAFLYFDEYKVLPAAGGLLDQSASLVAAFDVIRSEKLAIERTRAEKAEKEREREEKVSAFKARGGVLGGGPGRMR